MGWEWLPSERRIKVIEKGRRKGMVYERATFSARNAVAGLGELPLPHPRLILVTKRKNHRTKKNQ